MNEGEIDTEYTDFPVCPRCSCKDQDWWDGLPPKYDGDEWEARCPHCSSKYKVTMCVDVDFSTELID